MQTLQEPIPVHTAQSVPQGGARVDREARAIRVKVVRAPIRAKILGRPSSKDLSLLCLKDKHYQTLKARYAKLKAAEGAPSKGELQAAWKAVQAAWLKYAKLTSYWDQRDLDLIDTKRKMSARRLQLARDTRQWAINRLRFKMGPKFYLNPHLERADGVGADGFTPTKSSEPSNSQAGTSPPPLKS